MKENLKSKKIFSLVSFVLFLALVVILGVADHFADQKKSERPSSISITWIDWEKIYPYEWIIHEDGTSESLKESELDALKGKKSRNIKQFVKQYENKMNRLESINKGWVESINTEYHLAEIAFRMNQLSSDERLVNRKVNLLNGHWVGKCTTGITEEEAIEGLKDYRVLQNYLDTKGIDFLFVYPPYKECAYDTEEPALSYTCRNEIIDQHMKTMENLGIHYVDMRNNLHEQGLDHYSLYFRTDHHWTLDGAMWGASEVTKELNERFGYTLQDFKEFGSFRKKIYPDAMFGSQGSDVTHANADSEDFFIYFPEFETNYQMEIPDLGIDQVGSFEEVMANYEKIDECMENGGGYVYESMLYGNRPYMKITNLNCPDGIKIFMIKDSNSLGLVPYLSLSCSEIVMVDTRPDCGNFTGSIITCINEFEPDVVLSLQGGPQENFKLNQFED